MQVIAEAVHVGVGIFAEIEDADGFGLWREDVERIVKIAVVAGEGDAVGARVGELEGIGPVDVEDLAAAGGDVDFLRIHARDGAVVVCPSEGELILFGVGFVDDADAEAVGRLGVDSGLSRGGFCRGDSIGGALLDPLDGGVAGLLGGDLVDFKQDILGPFVALQGFRMGALLHVGDEDDLALQLVAGLGIGIDFGRQSRSAAAARASPVGCVGSPGGLDCGKMRAKQRDAGGGIGFAPIREAHHGMELLIEGEEADLIEGLDVLEDLVGLVGGLLPEVGALHAGAGVEEDGEAAAGGGRVVEVRALMDEGAHEGEGEEDDGQGAENEQNNVGQAAAAGEGAAGNFAGTSAGRLERPAGLWDCGGSNERGSAGRWRGSRRSKGGRAGPCINSLPHGCRRD